MIGIFSIVLIWGSRQLYLWYIDRRAPPVDRGTGTLSLAHVRFVPRAQISPLPLDSSDSSDESELEETQIDYPRGLMILIETPGVGDTIPGSLMDGEDGPPELPTGVSGDNSKNV